MWVLGGVAGMMSGGVVAAVAAEKSRYGIGRWGEED